MLLLLSLLKAFSEILAFSLLGQGLLRIVLGKSRATNFAYRMFAAVTRPLMRLARFVTPRFVPDRHVWIVAAFMVIVVWVVVGQQKLRVCRSEAAADPLCVEIKQALEQQRLR